MAEALSGHVVVVSPHLDDGVFSLGATVARATRWGARVEVLTVFGCEPTSDAPANGWDSRGGFRTEGQAALARRAEDHEACRRVGAEPRWLAFRGGGYTPDKDGDEIWSAIAAAVAEADAILIPGFPLRNDDHAWLAKLFEDRPLRQRTARYAEQPYRYLARKDERLPGDGWMKTRVGLADRLRKRQAILAYRSQLPLLSFAAGRHRKLNSMLLHELFDQREALAWVSP